jgi:hypothetical protein
VDVRLKPQRLALVGRKRSQHDDEEDQEEEEDQEDQEDALNYGMFVHLVRAGHSSKECCEFARHGLRPFR